MTKPTGNIKRDWLLVPVVGTVVFVILYIVAALLYPGGSQADKAAKGFSWLHNYWCNLLNDNAINGELNPAKPVAMAGMYALCITLSFFWLFFPLYVSIGKIAKRTIQVSGVLAMVIALFLFTSLHDVVTNLASGFGVVAVTGVFIALYKNKRYILFGFGIFNLLLVALNNYVYYTAGMLVYLPVVQKISFASFLIWICSIAITLYRATLSGAAEL